VALVKGSYTTIAPVSASKKIVLSALEPGGIINNLKHAGLRQVLLDVTSLKGGLIGKINEKFSTGQVWRWTVQDGALPDYLNATTMNTGEGVVTTIDSKKMTAATKLSVARTLIHELVHAFLITYFYAEPGQASIDFPLILSMWFSTAHPDYNEIQHAQMEESLVPEIANALKEYAGSIDLIADDAVYYDLAWGGLDYQTSNYLTDAEKTRIENRLNAEQLNKVVASVRPAGPRFG
jgi:hypothetical protein